MTDFTATPNVGWGHHSAVARAGKYIFLSNIIGALPDGRIVHHWDDLPPDGQALKTGKRHLDFRESDLGAQTWVVLQRLQAILAANGSSLEGICKMQIYLTNKKHFPFMERVRMRLFDAQPPSSCLEVQQVDPTGEAMIAIDVVAAAVGEAGKDYQRIRLDSGNQSIGIFAPGVKTAEHLFLAGQIPIDLEDGHITLTWDDLPEAERPEKREAFDVDYWDGPLTAQTIDTYRQIERLLAVENLGLDDVVREKVYLRRLRDYGIYEKVHRRISPRGEHPVTAIQVSDVGTISAIHLEIDVVAALAGAEPRKQVIRAEGIPARNGDAFAVRSGSLIFVGARVAQDSRGRIVRTPGQLGGKAPEVASRIGRTSPGISAAACQTAAILNDMQTGLSGAGYGLANLRKLHIFLTDFRDYPGVSETLREYFPNNPPAVSVAQVPVVGPGDGATVAIDAIGAA